MAGLLPSLLLCASTIHPDTIHDVAKTESDFQRFAIGVVNDKSIYPSSKADALRAIKTLETNGKNYSVGMMQINKHNFAKYGVTAEDMLDPCKNLSVFQKIITDCYVRGKTLPRALSCYYSGNFDTGRKPEKGFSNTSYTQRMGYGQNVAYVVPSTKQDIAKQNGQAVTVERIEKQERIIYPGRVLKNAFIEVNSPTKLVKE